MATDGTWVYAAQQHQEFEHVIRECVVTRDTGLPDFGRE